MTDSWSSVLRMSVWENGMYLGDYAVVG
jgi:hypothetical protein